MLAGSGVVCGATGGVSGLIGGGRVDGGGVKTSGGGGGIGAVTGGTSPALTPVGGAGGGKNAEAAVVEHIAIRTPAIAIPRKRRMELLFIDIPSSMSVRFWRAFDRRPNVESRKHVRLALRRSPIEPSRVTRLLPFIVTR
jgi:hypothetical protein